MEQVIIQDCGCIALPESIASAFDLKRGMVMDVSLTQTRDAILLRQHHAEPAKDALPQATPAASCVILPPSR